MIGGLWGPVLFSVEDQQAAETAHLRKLGLKDARITRSLMVRDERLPRSVETTEAFRLAAQILWAVGIYGVGRHDGD